MAPKRRRVGLHVVCSNDFEASSSSAAQISRRTSIVSRRAATLRSSVSVQSVSDFSSESAFYLDLGSCTELCQYCGASFWFVERLKSAALSARPKYNGCCKDGRIRIVLPREPPATLRELMSWSHFQNNIRAYNCMFAMTSFGAYVDESINNGTAPYVFKVAGQISHWVGSLCPERGERPRFLQMYIYDPLNEIVNRLRFFSSDATDGGLKESVVITISAMLDAVNTYVHLFRTARDMCLSSVVPEFCIKLYSRLSDRRYDLPTSQSVGAIISGGDLSSHNFDVVIYNKANHPQRISRLHPSYMPLQYPILLPYGDMGWSPELVLTDGHRLSPSMYYSFQLHDRPGYCSHMLRCGRLLQQYIVDAYVCVEQCRLEFIRNNQHTFRSEFLTGIHDAVCRGDVEGRSVGRRIILPSSFTGSPRYMYKHYQDALALCRVYGNPQYFITFTCNARWPEIRRELARVQCSNASDRPDIVVRVFEEKVKAFIKFLKENKPFGSVEAELYTIEFQKRGLPHCHTLIWVSTDSCIKDAQHIDRYISAELPNQSVDPALFKIVTECMLHGPCGSVNPLCSCMKNGRCSKKFPKSYEISTFFDKEGYVHYRRRIDTQSYVKNGVPINNDFVVPYNRQLLLHFDAHINVEYCGWSMLIKYLFKYISKGADRIRYSVGEGTTSAVNNDSAIVDEVTNYVEGRYICPYEAVWRIFGFSIHHRRPSVQVLAVHLDGYQYMTFRENDRIVEIADDEDKSKTTLTEWFKNNVKESAPDFDGPVDGLRLRYSDYLTKYRWDTGGKKWLRRKTKRIPAVGRLAYVHPSSGETFYLRLLLNSQVGCCSFEDVRTVNGAVCSTYRDACERLGLIGNDMEWTTTMDEAAEWASAAQLRALFAHMLLFCDVSNPQKLWEDHWEKFKDDILYQFNSTSISTISSISDYDLRQHILLDIERILNSCSTSRSLSDFNLPLPDMTSISDMSNRLILEERSYNRDLLAAEHQQLFPLLNSEQLRIYDEVVTANVTSHQCMIFVYGHGGTGKTFLWKTIIANLRSKGQIVLAVAASGIASLLLPSGRTAHSRFKLPLNLTEESVCYISKNTQLSQLLLETALIIWDEAPMSDRRNFESLDRTLRDLTDNRSLLFGGKSILLGGDFRQTLPVKRKSSKSQIITSCLPSSYLWPHFKVHRLLTNMRVRYSDFSNYSSEEVDDFSRWLLEIGDGKIGIQEKPQDPDLKKIDIPAHFCFDYNNRGLIHLIDFVYDAVVLEQPTASVFAERAIICPKNEFVNEINDLILAKCSGDAVSYFSTDSMVPHSCNGGDIDAMYPAEYLNMLDISGIPTHELRLKLNTPVMLMRNLDQKSGLCNGTRLLICRLLPRVIEAIIITGSSIGHKVFIPRINFVDDDKEMPFVFTRKQFPIRVCYAMSINKSQGQSLKRIGLYLAEPIFSHGQLYVALSRSKSPDSLRIVIKPMSDVQENKTSNIVYLELLRSIESI